MSLLLFYILALLCEIAGTIGGFGSSVFFVPMAEFFFSINLVLGITSLLHLFSNLSKIRLFTKHINIKITLLFGIPGILLSFLGAMLTPYYADSVGQWVLGGFLLIFGLLLFFNPNFILPATNKYAVGSGAIAGLFAGFTGTGGAIRGLGLAAFGLEKSMYIATSAAIDMGVDLTRFVVYAQNGYLAGINWQMVIGLLLVSYIGTLTGKKLLTKISQERFMSIVTGLISITGLITIVKLLAQ